MKKERGSIALITILIISAISILLVVGMSEVSINTRSQISNDEAEKINNYSAEACLEEALIKLEEDSSYSSGSLTINSDTNCSILVSGTNPKTITITTDFINYSETYEALVQIQTDGQAINTQLLDWHETQ